MPTTMTGKGGKPVTEDDIRASIAQSAFDAGYRLGMQDAMRPQVKGRETARALIKATKGALRQSARRYQQGKGDGDAR